MYSLPLVANPLTYFIYKNPTEWGSAMMYWFWLKKKPVITRRINFLDYKTIITNLIKRRSLYLHFSIHFFSHEKSLFIWCLYPANYYILYIYTWKTITVSDLYYYICFGKLSLFIEKERENYCLFSLWKICLFFNKYHENLVSILTLLDHYNEK